MPRTIQLGLLLITILSLESIAQKRVAFTIDDVPTPSTSPVEISNRFLSKIDSMGIPATIFINEERVRVDKHQKTLEAWLKHPLITPGNHTFNHPRYSITPFDQFIQEVKDGERLTRPLAEKYNKELKHFRFPFNDLGKDSAQHILIENALHELNYQISPFTVESSDWMFNALYTRHIKKGELEKAKAIGEQYVNATMDYFDHFEELSQEMFNRDIAQIYLCHDNLLNLHYAPEIITQLKARGYEIISMDEALEDEVYALPTFYYKKYGVSWFYRWMQDSDLIDQYMRAEPDLSDAYKAYENRN